MSDENSIDAQKERAFNQIGEILLGLDTQSEDNGFDKTAHILDILEQLLARVISGSSISNETIDEMCQESFDNIKKMAKQFLFEENAEK